MKNDTGNTLGAAIKKYREAKGITQKSLADSLSVTPQAVSRWENDLVEPDVNTIKELATVLEVSVSKLLNSESEPTNVVTSKETIEGDALLGTCVKCGTRVRESNVGRRMSLEKRYRSGRTWQVDPPHPELTCKECLAREKKQTDTRIEGEKRSRIYDIRARRKKALTHGIIWTTLLLIIGFSAIFNGNIVIDNQPVPLWTSIPILIVFSYFVFSTIVVVILDNTFLGEMIVTIFTWGFVRMPGLIFSLSLDGIIWLLTVKLLFFIIGIMLALFTGFLALAIGIPLGGFMFPFALIKSINEEKQIKGGLK